MISEAFFIIIVSGALNGAMCYSLYFQIKKDLSKLREYITPPDEEQIELQVLDKLDTPVSGSDSGDATVSVEQTDGEVFSDGNHTIDENVAGEVKDVLDTIICGTSCNVDDSVDRSLLTVESEQSDCGSNSPIGAKQKSNSSFLGLGSWLWQQDKTISRKENGANNNTNSAADQNT